MPGLEAGRKTRKALAATQDLYSTSAESATTVCRSHRAPQIAVASRRQLRHLWMQPCLPPPQAEHARAPGSASPPLRPSRLELSHMLSCASYLPPHVLPHCPPVAQYYSVEICGASLPSLLPGALASSCAGRRGLGLHTGSCSLGNVTVLQMAADDAAEGRAGKRRPSTAAATAAGESARAQAAANAAAAAARWDRQPPTFERSAWDEVLPYAPSCRLRECSSDRRSTD